MELNARDAVPIQEATSGLASLIARAEAGEEVVLRRGDAPVAKIVPYADDGPPVRTGRFVRTAETQTASFADYIG